MENLGVQKSLRHTLNRSSTSNVLASLSPMKSSDGGAALYGGSGLASAAMLPPKAQKLSKMGTV